MKRIALAALPLLLVTACGGGDDDAGTSKADYLARAEALCKRANADVDALAFPTTPAGFPVYIGKIVTLAEGVRDQLKALEAPEDDRAELKSKVFDPLDAQIPEGRAYQKAVADAVAANDQKKLGQLIGNPPTQTKADLGWMRSYGFKECVEVLETD